MKVSLDWLSDFVDLAGVDPEQLSAEVTEKVAEVEHVTKTGCDAVGVVTGKILKIEPVERADRIQLTTIDVGSEKLQIICGAKNIRAGQIVPVATVGTVLPTPDGKGFEIDKRKLKGVESCGMLCSEAELGIAEDAEGILILPPETPVGQPFSKVVSGDTILEVDNHSITHRPDLFGQLGFAREIAVLLGQKLKIPDLKSLEFDGKLKVVVKEPKLCPRYIGIQISGVRVGPSPAKVRERLEVCGVRAINNVVDATNYVLLELGQPMHAFDAEKIAGEIQVRKAKQGEKLATLDGETRELNPEMLVITDSNQLLAIAGVMGGAGSEVTGETTEIILEAANFDASSIRRTSTVLALRSESSLRFEKRLDPELPSFAVARFLEVLGETCPDMRVGPSTDVMNFKSEKRVLDLSLAELEKKLGTKIAPKQIEQILKSLEFEVTFKKADKIDQSCLRVTVPSFRAGRDIEIAEDLIEEIARHYSYNQIESSFPRIEMTAPERDPARELVAELQDTLVGLGFHETCTLSLVSTKLLEDTGQDASKAAEVENPPSEDHKLLRTRLLPGLLEVAASNSRHTESFRLFEIGTVFEKEDKGIGESQVVVALITGEDDPYAAVHGVAETLLASLKFPAKFTPAEDADPSVHPGRVAAIQLVGKPTGIVAEVHPAICAKFEIPRTAYLYLAVDTLAGCSRETVLAQPLPRYPGVPRDLAVIVSSRTLTAEVQVAIASVDPRVSDLQLFDTYTGEGIETGQKSLAFRFEIRDPEKTLEEKEAETVFVQIVKNLEGIGGKLRS